jgi:Domain of unknown function (DUF3482)
MRKAGLICIVLAAGMSVGACATGPYDRYGYDDGYGYDPYRRAQNNEQMRDAATGAAVGAAVGAGVGAVVGGISPVEGAVAGAVAGGAIGAATSNQRYYRDRRGCYYVDRDGYRRYDYNQRC